MNGRSAVMRMFCSVLEARDNIVRTRVTSAQCAPQALFVATSFPHAHHPPIVPLSPRGKVNAARLTSR